MISQVSNFSIRSLRREEFPQRLTAIEKPPETLYYRGTIPPFPRSWIAMVGTRRPSRLAEDTCRRLVKNLRGTDAVVVSGLAQGIDSFCHDAALQEGIPTVAVIAQGLATEIGGSRGILAQRILENGGAILSEYPANTQPLKFMFPARNRIIAGLSQSVVLVESKPHGGGIITAELALKFHRKVLGVPGSLIADTSQGVHRLIRAGSAIPIWDPEDFSDLCGSKRLSDPTFAGIAKNGIVLEGDTRKLFEANVGSTCTLDALHEESGLGIPTLLTILTELEMAGLVRTKDDGEFHFSSME